MESQEVFVETFHEHIISYLNGAVKRTIDTSGQVDATNKSSFFLFWVWQVPVSCSYVGGWCLNDWTRPLVTEENLMNPSPTPTQAVRLSEIAATSTMSRSYDVESLLSAFRCIYLKYNAVIFKSPRPLRLKIGLSRTENKITMSTTPIFFQT